MVYGMWPAMNMTPVESFFVKKLTSMRRSRNNSRRRRRQRAQGRRRRLHLLNYGHKKVCSMAQQKKLHHATTLANGCPDLEELSLGSTMKTHFPNPDDILNFELTIDPDEGMYKGGHFKFDFKINQNFPHDPPKVKCTQKIYHPNIDLEGNVCLNILREDWKPVLNLNAVVVGLQV